MRTPIPTLVAIELPDTFVYSSSAGLPDVEYGFVPKSPLTFVFRVKEKVGRERINEREGARLAADSRVRDASHHINT